MKKIILTIAALLMLGSHSYAKASTNGHQEEIKIHQGKKMPTRFQAVAPHKAEILQTGKSKMFCPHCGMTLPMFYKTNYTVKVQGKIKQYCSLHCLAEAMAQGEKVTNIQVVDTTTLKFIDAQKASYVVGSSKAATMSKVSKYAFADKADAQAFAKKFGGKVMPFKDTLALVQHSLAKESAMIRKKQKMMAKKGEMMFQKMCQPVERTFHSVAEAKTYLNTQKPCGELKGKKLQAIGLYLKFRNQ
ncbi:hypothetical protein MNB_SV-3-511 [hydrothermal vent metagenome]|uniref:Nitrous oxide reductase maturation protein, outer-membrane lipoprotein NosL n=1 Tax=hydrothermal vent metagenome TaxID=652676 RepID=A0A1W1CDG8_9ZZZZ